MTTRALLEAIMFVAEEPLPATELAALLELPRRQIEDELRAFAADLDDGERGVTLLEVAGGWRMYTHPDARPYLERFASSARATRLSSAALETLSVIAYRQPVSRAQVSEIRGVDAERAIQTLERRGLVADVGRAPGPGQAVLYGTTPLFLEKLGVNSLDDLPPLADHVPPASVVEVLEEPFRPDGVGIVDAS